MIPTTNTSVNFHDHAEVDKIDVPTMKTFMSKYRNLVLSAESIVDRWYVGMNDAKQTYEVTTQKGVRSVILPLSRR